MISLPVSDMMQSDNRRSITSWHSWKSISMMQNGDTGRAGMTGCASRSSFHGCRLMKDKQGGAEEMSVSEKKAQIVPVTVYGTISEICYFLINSETKKGVLIDPGAEPKRLLEMIRSYGWQIEKIILTHGHFDHITAVNQIREELQIPVYAYETADTYLLNPAYNLSGSWGDAVTVKNVLKLKEGESIDAAGFTLQVIHTPGHTEDSMILYCEEEGFAFSGDTIFCGSIGRWDFPGGDYRTLQTSIIRKIFTLPEETILYSGHSEPTDVGTEKRRYGF